MAEPLPGPFFLGVNYPWLNYARDFGQSPSGHDGVSLPRMQQRIAQDFARIRECGATVVRWFVFGDGRGGFLTEKGIPRKPDPFLFPDVAAALQLAERFDLKLCFSLIDFLWLQDHGKANPQNPQSQVLQFAAGREGFLEDVLIPLFTEFRAHPALFAWEIANEPEWAIREFHRDAKAKFHFADFRAFAEEIAQAVHDFAGVPVTLGSARLMWLRAWTELGLDLYQAHYYPATERDTGAGLAAQLAKLSALDKPLWLGEIPARDASPGYSAASALSICRAAGVHGAAIWRWTQPEPGGTDTAIGAVEPEALQAWASTQPASDLNA